MAARRALGLLQAGDGAQPRQGRRRVREQRQRLAEPLLQRRLAAARLADEVPLQPLGAGQRQPHPGGAARPRLERNRPGGAGRRRDPEPEALGDREEPRPRQHEVVVAAGAPPRGGRAQGAAAADRDLHDVELEQVAQGAGRALQEGLRVGGDRDLLEGVGQAAHRGRRHARRRGQRVDQLGERGGRRLQHRQHLVVHGLQHLEPEQRGVATGSERHGQARLDPVDRRHVALVVLRAGEDGDRLSGGEGGRVHPAAEGQRVDDARVAALGRQPEAVRPGHVDRGKERGAEDVAQRVAGRTEEGVRARSAARRLGETGEHPRDAGIRRTPGRDRRCSCSHERVGIAPGRARDPWPHPGWSPARGCHPNVARTREEPAAGVAPGAGRRTCLNRLIHHS